MKVYFGIIIKMRKNENRNYKIRMVPINLFPNSFIYLPIVTWR